MLEQGHYTRKAIDENLSRRALHEYIDVLDYGHFFFLQPDIDRFDRLYGDAYMNRLQRDADVGPAYDIFHVFEDRLRSRVASIKTLAGTKFDFSKDESILADRRKAPWPATEAEADDLWRRQIKAELLQEKLNQEKQSKAKPEEQEKTVRQRYDRLLRSVLEYDSNDVLELYLTSLAHAFDPHSDYLAASQKANLDISIRLSLVGIGAVLKSEDGYVSIVSLVPGGPADLDKRLKPTDKIEAVAQAEGPFEDVVGMKLDKVVQLIRGEKGTMVRLKVIPADAVSRSTRVIIPLVRDEIHLREQEAKAKLIDLPVGGRVVKLGAIDLPSFYSGEGKSTAEDVATLVGKLKKKGAEGILIDLRRNPGGVLSEAVGLSGYFTGQGPVVQVKDPDGVKVLDAVAPPERYDGPLVVLTSRMSASASEIFAGAMEDYGRAVVVGDDSSFGKGTVQSIVDLASTLPSSYRGGNPGALKLTIQKFYRVSGASTQNRGVKPDIVLPSITDAMDSSESSLDNALPYDEVPAVQYNRTNSVSGSLPGLKAASAARVAASGEFGYVRQDMELLTKQKADKNISLNEKKRLAELDERNKRDEARKKERLAHKTPEPKTETLTVEDTPPPATPPSKSTATAEGDYEKAPPAPDVELDEGLHILADLIQSRSEPAAHNRMQFQDSPTRQ
jgi:carboxyl-terminal processing protease